MIDIFRKKLFFLKIRELYFCCEADVGRNYCVSSDINIYIQSQFKSNFSHQFSTVINNLEHDEKFIFNNISKSFRYEINRAINKDKFKINFIYKPKKNDLIRFKNIYDAFAKTKNLAKFNSDKLEKFLVKNRVIITEVLSDNSSVQPYAVHLYIHDDYRIRLYYSANTLNSSQQKNDHALIGRANKYLHWKDMCNAKSYNFREYDFGGISTNNRTKGIDDFKSSFGGEVEISFNSFVPMSFIGIFFLKIWFFLRK